MACSPAADNIFGPAVHGCRSDFDFTLLFEQSFFQIAPSALLLLSLPPRALYLRSQDIKTRWTATRALKQAAIASLAGTQLALLIVWTLTPISRTRASIPAALLSFLASFALLYLSSVEHARSVRPSTVINGYLLGSSVLDVPQARTLWLRIGPRSVPAIYTAGMVAKAVILYLEARNKRRSLFPPHQLSAPESLVSVYDRTVLWWLNPLFWKGYKSLLSVDALGAIDQDLCSTNVEEYFRAAWNRTCHKSRRALLWALLRSVWLSAVGIVIPRLCLGALKLSQPLLINSVTAWLSEDQSGGHESRGKGLIGATVCIYMGLAITQALYQRQLHRLLTKVRGALISTTYAKTLALRAEDLADKRTITFVTADVSNVCRSLQRIDDLFASPLELLGGIILLERQIGVSCIAPVAFVALVVLASILKSNKAVPSQKAWLSAVEARVAYTASVLGCSKSSKMLGLSDFLEARTQALRVLELALQAKFRNYSVVRNTYGALPQALAPPITLMMFSLIHGGAAVTTTVAFTTLALVGLISAPISNLIHAVPLLQQALASLDRIQAFLVMDEYTTSGGREDVTPPQGPPTDGIPLASLPSNSRSGWTSPAFLRLNAVTLCLGNERRAVLRNIDMHLPAASLTLIVGPVGCGKSTLLRALINELPITHGHIDCIREATSISYCAQEPWLPNGTIRQLVTYQTLFDRPWYDTVLEACALHRDIASFPHGDSTNVGTNGATLSGGQKQRVALARALYARNRLLVVDDALSGLDAMTSYQLFDRVFSPTGLCKQHGITVALATHAVQFLHQADHIVALGLDGTVAQQGSFSELSSLHGYVSRAKLNTGQPYTEPVEPVGETSKPSASIPVNEAQQDLARKIGDVAVYGYYARSIGWKYGITIVSTAVMYGLTLSTTSIWVRVWSGSEASKRGHLALWLPIYILIASCSVASTYANMVCVLLKTVPKSAAKIHEQILRAAMRAPYSFFVSMDTGVLLNRFSSDMTAIELDLAVAVMQVLDWAVLCVASAALIAAGARYVGVAIPLVIFVLYCLQRFYLRTSRQLRLMEIEANAPLISQFSETLAGISTIRAFGWRWAMRHECWDRLDASQRPYYLMLCIQRWLTLVLDLITAAIATIVVGMAVLLAGSASAGSIGVAMLNVLSFNQYLAILIQAWTSLETSLGAVARCKAFERTTPIEDASAENAMPAEDWPQSGQMDLFDVRASYGNDGKEVLRSITLSIKPGEKVGICGRSGSGKSSLLLTILRLLDLSSGSIAIDGVDLSTIPRQTTRSRLTALPQEAMLLPGSLRDNLDPLNHGSDDDIEDVLRRVGLLDTIEHCGGLRTPMVAVALSQGQIQLFAVARALLRKSKILIVDEMTAAVDAETEKVMMKLVLSDFSESTIVAVAHRLDTLMDFDKVVVMDAGTIVECGSPHELLLKPDSHFKAMRESSSA